MQAAGLMCWEFTYGLERFTWFDGLPGDAGHDAAELERRQLEIIDSILPEDRERVREATRIALEAGENSLCSMMRLRDRDGQVRHLRLYQRFFRDPSGKPIRALGSTRDVTAEVVAAEELQRQAELLRETQRRLERASMSIQEGHWEIDVRTRRHWASKSY